MKKYRKKPVAEDNSFDVLEHTFFFGAQGDYGRVRFRENACTKLSLALERPWAYPSYFARIVGFSQQCLEFMNNLLRRIRGPSPDWHRLGTGKN